jgi:carboxyl-terminal processing protease
MPQGTQLKLTTSYYYTPSGRCIQAFEYNEGNQIQIADSLKKVFKTKNGREVFSSGGITPDIVTEYRNPPAVVQSLQNDLMIFDFATQYKLSHSTIVTANSFYLTNEDYSAFIEFVKSKKFNHPTETENKLVTLKETAEKEGYWQSIQNSYLQLEKDMNINKEKELTSNKNIIKQELEKEILYRYYGQAGRYEASLRDDAEVIKAMEVLMDLKTYNRLLNKEIE